MKSILTAAAVALIGAAGVAATAQAQNAAHAHIGHVMTAWGDTPDGAGLLPTAQAEAAIAMRHVNLALAEAGNLDGVRLHLGHVLNAVDPTVEPTGPGLGYGVIAAAQGVVAHIGFAAGSAGASDAVTLHAVHVATSAGNVAAWMEQVKTIAAEGRAADTAEAALAAAVNAQMLLAWAIDGRDADGDGQISWVAGEGGLAQAEQHMGFMMQAEGL